MTGKVNNDLLCIIIILGLPFEKRLPVKVIQIIIFSIYIQRFPIQHLIVDILIVGRDPFPNFLRIFLRPAHDIIKKAFLFPNR